MKKILLFLLLLFPFFVDASSMYQEIDILENGDLKVRESISLEGSYNGFELSIGYRYFDEYKIYSADALEVIRVCESDKKNPLEEVGACFEKVQYASKGDSLKYTHDVGNSKDTFMLYNPSSRGKAFYVEYILKNVIVKHNDINELRLNMLDSSFRENLDVVNIRVNLPSKVEDLRGWAHGPLWGNIKVDDNKEYVLFTIDDYDAYTEVDIRMTFDKSVVNTNKLTNEDKLQSIIKEETHLADEANKIREEYKEKEREEQELIKRKNKNLAILSGIWFVAAGILFFDYYKKYDKEYDSNFNLKYFRDFPSNHSPEIVEYLMNKKVSSVSLSASILNIIYKKGFIIEKTQIEKGIIRKKMVDDYELISNDKNLKEELTEEEIMLREWLLSEVGNGNRLLLSDFKKVDNSEGSARSFIAEFNKWVSAVEKTARKQNFYEETSSKKALLILFSCIPFGLIKMYIEYNKMVLLLAPVALALMIYIFISKKRTKEGNELYRKWLGLKNFLKDFGNFKEKELPDIKLWEKYLVYAHVFGVAEELRKQMEIKMPNVEEFSDGLSTYDYIRLNNILSRNITTTVNAAISSANAKIAESNASSGSGSGGGFSGGFGGGGFSGGGGSGGGRF